MKFLIALIAACALTLGSANSLLAQAAPESGTVAETINAGSYIYIRLEEPDVWVATGPLDVAQGDQVEITGGMEMRDFHSKALDRTFESIWFAEHVSVSGRDLDKLHQMAESGHGATPPPIPRPSAVAAPAAGEIARLEDGMTIAEIQADPAALRDQKVGLRARVIKVSDNIMGKNWITLQDGTGTAPNDKLLATSLESVSPGETVTVHGVVRNDVDLGSGYRYDMLLEDATFAR
jgi:hypothetical protein